MQLPPHFTEANITIVIITNIFGDIAREYSLLERLNENTIQALHLPYAHFDSGQKHKR